MGANIAVMPAKAGIHVSTIRRHRMSLQTWTPAFAGVTNREEVE